MDDKKKEERKRYKKRLKERAKTEPEVAERLKLAKRRQKQNKAKRDKFGKFVSLLTEDEKYTRNIEKKFKSIEEKYGLTLEQYQKLVLKQKGKCKICKQECPMYKALVIDHCHITGTVRGLLCNHCNSILGFAYDNIDVLKNAIKYLKAAPPLLEE